MTSSGRLFTSPAWPTAEKRLLLFSAWFVLEWLPISILVGSHYSGFRKDIGAGHILQLGIICFSLIVAFGFVQGRAAFAAMSMQIRNEPVDWRFAGAHAVAFAVFIALCLIPNSELPPGSAGNLVLALWFLAGVASIAFSGFVFVPPRVLFRFFAGSEKKWLLLIAGGILGWPLSQTAWFSDDEGWNHLVKPIAEPVTHLTFNLVKLFLGLFIPVVQADWRTVTIGSPAFNVSIGVGCAGFEGTGLMLVFATAWVCMLRDEFRFPRSLLLIAAGMGLMWVSNALRITALILIGIAGFPDVALGGFHSQAGWILFNLVGIWFVVVSPRLRWFTTPRSALPISGPAESSNPTASYLLPFLVIIGSGMIARAASSSFELLYPLRVVAAVITIWLFRKEYARLDWRFGPLAVVAGAVVAALWLGLDWLSGPHQGQDISSGLAALSPAGRYGWIVFRTIGAVLTVPVAEELAFRGFLIRRFLSSNFDSLEPMRFSVVAVALSSLSFGLLHGERWIVGTVAGLLYAGVFLRRGRIGDAVIAHAVSNAVLAAFVLLGGKWFLW